MMWWSLRRWVVVAGVIVSVLAAAAQTPSGVYIASQYCAHAGQLDETCINAAGAAATVVGGEVYIPAGTYTISNPVTFYSRVTYDGAGQGLTLLQEAPGVGLPRPFASQAGATALTLRNFTLDGNETYNTQPGQIQLLDMDGVTFSTLENITVQNFYGYEGSSGPCIGFDDITADNLVQNVRVDNCGGPGRLSDGIYIGGYRNRVIGNLIDTAGDTGIVAETGVDEVISDNVIRNTPQPISVDGLIADSSAQGVAISGNTIDGADASNGAAIYIVNAVGSDTQRIAITGNVISGLTDGHGILVEDSADLSISGNQLSQISPSQPVFKTGIIAINSDELDITGNSVQGASGSGIDIQGGTSDVVSSNLLLNNGLVRGFGVVIEDGTSFSGQSFSHGNGACTINLSSPGYFQPGDVVTVTATDGDPACLGQHTLTGVGAGYATISYSVPGSGPPGTVALITRNSSFITVGNNQAHGAQQVYGLWIAGGSTDIFVQGNQLAGNANANGLLNTASGQIELGTNQLTESADASTGGLQVTGGGLSLGNGVAVQSVTPSGVPVNLMMLTADATPITRFMAGDDAGGFQWTDQGQSEAWMDLNAAGLSFGGGARLANSSALAVFVGVLDATANLSDILAVSGLAGNAHCFAQAADAVAASLTGVYVTVQPGAVVLHHSTAAGGQFDLFCSAD